MKGRSALTDILALLLMVEEAESTAHKIWDDSSSNLAYGRLSKERRDYYINRTYDATRQHAKAMDALREAIDRLKSMR